MESIALLTQLFIAALAAITVAHYSGLPALIKTWINRNFSIPYTWIKVKPLDCHVCLAFWLALVYRVASVTQNGPFTLGTAVQVLLQAVAASAISHFLYRHLSK